MCVFVMGQRRQSAQVIEAGCASLCSVENLWETTYSYMGMQKKHELRVSWVCIDHSLLRTSAVVCDPHPSPSPFNFTFDPHP